MPKENLSPAIVALAVSAASNGITLADPRLRDCPLIYTNEAFLRMTGYAEAEVIGRNCHFLQGPNTDPAAVREIREALREERGCQVMLLNYRKDGTTFWNEVTVSPVRDAHGALLHFVGIQTDITLRQEADGERRRVAAALRRLAERERFLSDLGERARRLTDPDGVIADAVQSVGRFLGASRCVFADIDIEADTCTIPSDYCADASVTSMSGTFPISAFGPYLVAAYGAGRTVVVSDVRRAPEQVPADYLAAYEAVACRAFVAVPVLHSSRLVSVIAVHSAVPREWTPDEVELLKSVVERTWLTVEVTRQQRALVREAESTTRILESITDGFYVIGRDWRFRYVNAQAERILARTREELLGRGIWEEFAEGVGSTFYHLHRRAMTEGIAVTAEDYYAPLDTWVDVRVYPSSDGLSVFFQDVTARKKAEQERERLLAEQSARAEREALLNRIGQTIRSAPAPQEVLEAAVCELGQALGASQCYYAAYDQDADTATVGPVWHRAGLVPLAGRYSMSRFAMNQDPAYKAGYTQVIADMRDDPAALELGLRALIRVPLVSGTSMTALSVAMADGPRKWTPDEVSLVEAVATQTQTALEAVRVRRREHNIAEQLARALQPETPASAPGLTLADYYRPAWEDQGVGGDFSDVFSGHAGVTFLVVGDLSGKGLAAASQVATVRQMLRFALLNHPAGAGSSVAEPVTALNRLLAVHGLLTGFATLFVGRYDAEARSLTYINCGQDAGLVLRAATGTVEEMPHTGPVLGTFAGAAYSEETVVLEAGDVLALFTDGLTEAGPTRASMLTGEGVAALLREQAGGRDARQIASRLMAGVDAYAGRGLRDDQCLLVAVVDG